MVDANLCIGYKGTAPKSSGSDPDPGLGSSGKELAP